MTATKKKMTKSPTIAEVLGKLAVGESAIFGDYCHAASMNVSISNCRRKYPDFKFEQFRADNSLSIRATRIGRPTVNKQTESAIAESDEIIPVPMDLPDSRTAQSTPLLMRIRQAVERHVTPPGQWFRVYGFQDKEDLRKCNNALGLSKIGCRFKFARRHDTKANVHYLWACKK